MFIYKPNTTKESQLILKKTKEKFNILPPHWELLALISPKRFEMFINEIEYLLNHPRINSDFFTMLRLHVANRENFNYCKSLNTKLLLAKGYDKNQITSIKEDIKTLPLDKNHKLLATKAIKAIYQAEEFNKEDIQELKDSSWEDSDIYDAIDHAAFIFKVNKILKAYLG